MRKWTQTIEDTLGMRVIGAGYVETGLQGSLRRERRSGRDLLREESPVNPTFIHTSLHRTLVV